MKKILTLVIVVAICWANAALAQPVSATLGIDGLTCSMCAKGTESSLRSLEFIREVDMNLNTLEATIQFKANTDVSLDKLVKAVIDAGFSVRTADVAFQFQNLKVSKDYHFNWNGAQYHFVDAPETTLNGVTKLRVIDKDFIVADEYEQWKKEIQFECYETGMMKPCCSVEKIEKPVRVYHIAMEKKQ